MASFPKIVAALTLGLSGLITPAWSESGEKNAWPRQFMEHRQRFMAEELSGAKESLRNGTKESLRNAVQQRIVGGEEAPAGLWPFHVGLLLKEIEDKYEAQYCSGVLIDPRWVVTVAHCVDWLDDRRQVEVLVGTQDLRSGSRRSVRRIIIHPDYNPNTFDSDIAVLQLSSVVNEQVAALAGPSQETRFAPNGAVAYIAGWGDTDPDSADVACCFPYELHQARTRIQPSNDCNDADSYHGQITENMICAGFDEGGPGACLLDAGGPLVVRNQNGLFRALVGLSAATADYECGELEEFTVFTRISQFKPWINEQIEQFTP